MAGLELSSVETDHSQWDGDEELRTFLLVTLCLGPYLRLLSGPKPFFDPAGPSLTVCVCVFGVGWPTVFHDRGVALQIKPISWALSAVEPVIGLRWYLPGRYLFSHSLLAWLAGGCMHIIKPKWAWDTGLGFKFDKIIVWESWTENPMHADTRKTKAHIFLVYVGRSISEPFWGASLTFIYRALFNYSAAPWTLDLMSPSQAQGGDAVQSLRARRDSTMAPLGLPIDAPSFSNWCKSWRLKLSAPSADSGQVT